MSRLVIVREFETHVDIAHDLRIHPRSISETSVWSNLTMSPKKVRSLTQAVLTITRHEIRTMMDIRIYFAGRGTSANYPKV